MKIINLFIFLYCLIPILANCQSEEFVGIIGSYLVKTDAQSAATDTINMIDLPSGDQVRYLAFVPDSCLFYGVISGSNNPTLVSISFDGSLSIIGAFDIQGETAYFCEGLSYNLFDQKMYAAVSIDGPISSGDFFSEAVVEISLDDATCSIKTTITGNVSNPDIDHLVFIDNIMYFYDGNPGPNISYFFELDFLNIPTISTATELSSQIYYPAKDLEVFDGKIYFPTGNDLYYYDLASLTVQYVGQTHTNSEYGGEPMTGISLFDYPGDLVLSADTTLCEGETTIINISMTEGTTIEWNTGATGDSLEISAPGSYWAEVSVDNCIFQSDTIQVSILNPEISLGSDTTLCEGETFELSINFPGSSVIWNTGNSGNVLEISDPGMYWAEVLVDNCFILTDTIEVFYTLSPGDLELGDDIALCEGETFYLTLFASGGLTEWNTGATGDSLEISEQGVYWAEVNINNCIFQSDTINVTALESQTINLGADTTLCEGETLELEINIANSSVIWNTGNIGNIIEISETGTYWAEISTENCLVITDTILVFYTLIPDNLFLGEDTTLCEGETIILNLSIPGADILWNTGLLNETLEISEPGIYWADVSIGNCVEQSDTIQISYVALPNISLGMDTTICEDETFEISIEIPNSTITWNTGNIGNILEVTEQGIYSAEINMEICSFFSDSIEIAVVDCTPCQYYIPNAFSPNYDGVNDTFKVYFGETCDLESIEISVFDRWGGLRFRSKENKWDGVFESENSQSGVYVYLIKMLIISYDGTLYEVIESGDVSILK